MRKLLAIILTVSMLLGLSAVPAGADDVLASAYLWTGSDSEALLSNIDLAASALDGTFVAYGDTFSFNDAVGPRDAQHGYESAVNGRGSKVMGGGVSQVAAALYVALKELDGIDYIEKKTYGNKYEGSYVDSGDDAIVTDYGAGTDFSFENNYGDFTISIWLSGEELSCEILDGGGEGEIWDDESGDESGGTSGFSSIALDGNSALIDNITLASDAINGTVLYPGDTFSFNDVVGPRTAARGYQSAINGRGVKVTGGGVAQVASALWLAVKDMEDVTVTEKSVYGSKYNQSYVDSADDAILTDYSGGTDFCFRNDGAEDLTLYFEVVDDESLMCSVVSG